MQVEDSWPTVVQVKVYHGQHWRRWCRLQVAGGGGSGQDSRATWCKSKLITANVGVGCKLRVGVQVEDSWSTVVQVKDSRSTLAHHSLFQIPNASEAS